MCDEFFSFIKSIDENKYKEYPLNFSPGNTRNITKSSNDDKIRSDYNKGEILKFKIPLFCKIIFHAYTPSKNDDQKGMTTKTNKIFLNFIFEVAI